MLHYHEFITSFDSGIYVQLKKRKYAMCWMGFVSDAPSSQDGGHPMVLLLCYVEVCIRVTTEHGLVTTYLPADLCSLHDVRDLVCVFGYSIILPRPVDM